MGATSSVFGSWGGGFCCAAGRQQRGPCAVRWARLPSPWANCPAPDCQAAMVVRSWLSDCCWLSAGVSPELELLRRPAEEMLPAEGCRSYS